MFLINLVVGGENSSSGRWDWNKGEDKFKTKTIKFEMGI